MQWQAQKLYGGCPGWAWRLEFLPWSSILALPVLITSERFRRPSHCISEVGCPPGWGKNTTIASSADVVDFGAHFS